MVDWQVVYELKDDAERIALVQRATLTTRDFGLEPTHGLFGSPEWSRHVETGNLPLQTLKGTISRVYMGSMGDWPEFEMQCDDGSCQSFTRYQTAPDGSQDHLYAVGRRIEVDFVWQDFRHGASQRGLPPTSRVITAIRIASG